MLFSISQDSLRVLYLISFKIPIMFLMECIITKVSRTVGSTFDKICQSFKNYLLSNCGTAENITVVFNGYLVPSTKDSTHIWRNKGRLGRNIVQSLHNRLTAKKKVTFSWICIMNKHFLKCLGPNCQLLLLAQCIQMEMQTCMLYPVP